MADINVDVKLTEHGGDSSLLEIVLPLYSEVYAEPPYDEGPKEVEDFVERWNSQICVPGFKVVLARVDGLPVGFSFGLPLTPGTNWWNGLLEPLDDELTREYPGRTFAIIELAVLPQFRRRGIGKSLHWKLLAQRPERRVTLLSRADAAPAQAAYSTWGYQSVGHIQPGEDTPVYVAMIRSLPLEVE